MKGSLHATQTHLLDSPESRVLWEVFAEVGWVRRLRSRLGAELGVKRAQQREKTPSWQSPVKLVELHSKVFQH